MMIGYYWKGHCNYGYHCKDFNVKIEEKLINTWKTKNAIEQHSRKSAKKNGSGTY